VAQAGGERLGSTDWCYDSASLYGTADAGVLGNETPLSICIRRFLGATRRRPPAVRESRLPTLVQYDPFVRYFEAVADAEGRGQTLLFTATTACRWCAITSRQWRAGAVRAHDAFPRRLEIRSDGGARGHGWRGVHRLPFAFVFGRSNFTVSYFGANVYPENISVGLEQAEVRDWVTGKFVLQAKEGLTEAPQGHRRRAGAQDGRRRRQARHHRALDPEPSRAAEQRVQELRAGRSTARRGQPAATGDPEWFLPGSSTATPGAEQVAFTHDKAPFADRSALLTFSRNLNIEPM